jgi:uncharacterized repeat protein (TIGR03803 family)
MLWAMSPLVLIERGFAQQAFVYSFSGQQSPVSGVIFDTNGNLVGAKSITSGFNFNGSIYRLLRNKKGLWFQKVLHNFNFYSTEGYGPSAVIFDANGNLYGTTIGGGAHGGGTVFKLSPASSGLWPVTILHTFGSDPDGSRQPTYGMSFDANGNLYGVTLQGGPKDGGTVFGLTPASSGDWTEAPVYSFNDGPSDGCHPDGPLTVDANGNLYGTTYSGGAQGGGTVFELMPGPGGQWTEKVLFSFPTSGPGGYAPANGVTLDAAGNVYGTTSIGTFPLMGAVFKLSAEADGHWSRKILHIFGTHPTEGGGASGSLIFDTAGNLLGANTATGGFHLFELRPQPNGTWKYTVLVNFDLINGGSPGVLGLVLDGQGNIYGTTGTGGINGLGTMFEVIP